MNICKDQVDPLNIEFKIMNKNLEMVKVYKYLGVQVDCQLNYQHFKRIRKFITKQAAELVYKCKILPILEYADFILDQGVAYINNALQKIQNHCLLIIHNQHFFKLDERDSTETPQKSLDWPTEDAYICYYCPSLFVLVKIWLIIEIL